MDEVQTVSGRTIESWPRERLRPYENNPREHHAAKVRQFAGAIKRFGFRYPVLARSDGTVVDGHFRLKAADLLELTHIPVVVVDDMSEDQVKAFRISVNRMAELADWDEDALLKELEDLKLNPDTEELLGEDGPVGFDLEERDDELSEKGWEMGLTRDTFVVTLTGSLPLEAEVRELLKPLGDRVVIECSSIKRSS